MGTVTDSPWGTDKCRNNPLCCDLFSGLSIQYNDWILKEEKSVGPLNNLLASIYVYSLGSNFSISFCEDIYKDET